MKYVLRKLYILVNSSKIHSLFIGSNRTISPIIEKGTVVQISPRDRWPWSQACRLQDTFWFSNSNRSISNSWPITSYRSFFNIKSRIEYIKRLKNKCKGRFNSRNAPNRRFEEMAHKKSPNTISLQPPLWSSIKETASLYSVRQIPQ